MRKIAYIIAALSIFATASAQTPVLRHGDCMPMQENTSVPSHQQASRRLPAINTQWDASRTYHQAVLLIEFADEGFTLSDDPHAYYDAMFNQQGYSQRQGAGSFADYFRDQSRGLFNLQCDIYGPYKVSTKAQPYDNPTENTRNFGSNVMREATQMWIDANPSLNYKQYDWNGDGTIEQIIYIAAGKTGNQDASECYGYIWPNTSSFSPIKAPDETKINSYTISNETWNNGTSCGIGTICHEYAHSLGLPDIYPAHNGWIFSAVDEWDLMDGGNFTNYGSCPPNFSPLEKMLLGWYTPIELTTSTTITNMKPLAEDGDAYIVKHTDDEYLLLENRQQRGWDVGAPGKGLIVYHVNYKPQNWKDNSVNDTQDKPNYHLVAADNRNDYNTCVAYIKTAGLKQYAKSNRMNSNVFSLAPYPWEETAETIHDSLTDTSLPATEMYNNNTQSSTLLSKPITHITMTADGLISFNFMGGDPTGIKDLTPALSLGEGAVYDLSGRKTSTGKRGIYIIRLSDGTIKKVFK